MSEHQQVMREVVSCLARVWVLSSAPTTTKEHVYVDGKWVEITIQYNGDLEQPRRRAGDKAEVKT